MKNIHIDDDLYQALLSCSESLKINNNKLGECCFNVGFLFFIERILSEIKDCEKCSLSVSEADLFFRSGLADLFHITMVD